MEAVRGHNENGYIAIDALDFISEDCSFTPSEAKPPTTTKGTTPSTSSGPTTPQPSTEPPDGKYSATDLVNSFRGCQND